MPDIRSNQNTLPYSWGDNCLGWRLYNSKTLSIIQEQMPANTDDIMHYHEFSQQVFYILSGIANFEINGEIKILLANQSIHISKKELHKISNTQATNLCFLVISEPEVNGDRIEIIPYSDQYKDALKILNSEWLQKYYSLEPNDIIQLSNPKEEILDKNGLIYYAKCDDEIVGTISLLKVEDGIYELAKMAVSEKAQGRGIGNILMQHCINVANQKRMSKLILYSNTELGPAIHLYKKFGFIKTEMEPGHYKRSNIKMEMNLL